MIRNRITPQNTQFHQDMMDLISRISKIVLRNGMIGEVTISAMDNDVPKCVYTVRYPDSRILSCIDLTRPLKDVTPRTDMLMELIRGMYTSGMVPPSNPDVYYWRRQINTTQFVKADGTAEAETTQSGTWVGFDRQHKQKVKVPDGSIDDGIETIDYSKVIDIPGIGQVVAVVPREVFNTADKYTLGEELLVNGK